MNMLLGISLDVGQENLAAIQGAGGEVEAGVELGGGAVIFFEDFGGCGFFVVDPLEPKDYTSGMIMAPARRATPVSKISIWFTALLRFTSGFT